MFQAWYNNRHGGREEKMECLHIIMSGNIKCDSFVVVSSIIKAILYRDNFLADLQGKLGMGLTICSCLIV